MADTPKIPGMLRLPQPLPLLEVDMEMRAPSKRSKNRKPRSKPNSGQVGETSQSPEMQGVPFHNSYQPQPSPASVIRPPPLLQNPTAMIRASSQKQNPFAGIRPQNPTPSTRPQQHPTLATRAPLPQHHRNTYYASSSTSAKTNNTFMLPHRASGGVAASAFSATGLLPTPTPQKSSQSLMSPAPVPLWRRPDQEDTSCSSSPPGRKSSGPSTLQQNRFTQNQKAVPHQNQNYARVFYTMMDNPSLNARRDPEFFSYQKLPLSDQLEEMQAALSLTRDALGQRSQIVDDILLVLRKEFPLCLIYPFGSYHTGLGDSTSDVDLYVDAFGVTVGEKMPKTACSTLDVLERCYRSLRRAKCPKSYKVLCKHLIAIREARVPILKITHWSNVNLDLSFENLTSLRNSEMIRLYMKLDPVVKPLMVVIRFWARFHCLTGSNNIKNYCLVLMVLVFLTSKNIVPSVEKLQALREVERRQESNKSKNKDTNSDIIDGWDTGFADYGMIRSLKLTTKSFTDSEFGGDLVKAVLKLAQDFFNMFGNLDFSSCVVCTRTAEVLPLELFKPGNEEDLPEALDKYKDWAVQQPSNKRLNIRNPLCVQDPFILSFNVGAVTPFTTLFKFQVACREAFGILESGISSLLELFIPLPKEVGDRKFLNMQERQRETIKLKKDIDHFLEHGEFPPRSQLADTEVNPSAEESLGLHRLPLQEIIDKSSIRFGRGWESLSLLVPSDDFQNLFAETILKYKLHKADHSARDLFEKLKQLWLSFLDDFFEEFWEKCFMLKVHKDERELSDRLFANPPFGSRIRKNYELIFTEKRMRRNSKQNETSSSDFRAEDVANLASKLSELGNIHYKTTCTRLTCSALFPVWQKRVKIYNEIMDRENPVPTTEGNVESAPRSRRNKHRKLPIDMENCNPLNIQKDVTERLKKELQPPGSVQTDKPILTFVVYIKIESCFVDDVPVVSIVCEKLENTQTNLYNQGVSSIMETLNEVLEPYLMYRLKDWINPRSTGGKKLTNGSFSNSQESVQGEEDYDALMPPTPSSSECSSPVDDHDQFASLITGEWEDDKE